MNDVLIMCLFFIVYLTYPVEGLVACSKTEEQVKALGLVITSRKTHFVFTHCLFVYAANTSFSLDNIHDLHLC